MDFHSLHEKKLNNGSDVVNYVKGLLLDIMSLTLRIWLKLVLHQSHSLGGRYYDFY